MKKIWALLLACAMMLSLAACGAKEEAPKEEPKAPVEAEKAPEEAPAVEHSKELTVYTAFPEAEVIYYYNAFEEATGIKINSIRLSAGEMLTRVEAEKANPQAALMLGGPSDNYIAAVDKGLLEPYQAKDIDKAPEAYRDPTGHWSPIYVGAIGFGCNADWFAEKGLEYPTSWDDLLKPEFQGEIIMAHPGTSGTAYTVLATLVQLKGEEAVWDYLAELDKNIIQYTKSGAAAPNAVAMGEAAISLTFSHDALQPTIEGYPMALSFPADGTGYEIGAAAIVKGSDPAEQESAKMFIDWICSVDGQNLYAENDSFRVPTNVDATAAEGLVTLDKVNAIDFDAVWAAGVKSDYVGKFEEAIAVKPEA